MMVVALGRMDRAGLIGGDAYTSRIRGLTAGVQMEASW